MEYEHRENARDKTTSTEQFDSQTFFREHLVRSDNGNYEVKGEKLSAMELALLETEKRRRGTQAAVSREKIRADRFEAELGNVKKALPALKPVVVDEDLKYSDPDAYIEQRIKQQTENPYDEVFNTASREAATEVGRRSVAEEIKIFNENNPNRVLTEESLELDVPPRLVNDLQSGAITPQDFLASAAEILYSKSKVVNQELPSVPDLGAVGGQTTPTDDGSNDALIKNYASAVF